MKVTIDITPDKDAERVLNYYYLKTLDLYALKEIEKFKVSVEGLEKEHDEK